MSKVITERPRVKGWAYSRKAKKGYRKQTDKIPLDEQPKRESIKTLGGDTKQFTDVLGPLEGWVRKQIGRPWRLVSAELDAALPARGGVSLTHARGHLWDFLETKVIECVIDGKRWACYAENPRWRPWWRVYGYPILGPRPIAYVCPRTGLIKRAPLKGPKPPNKYLDLGRPQRPQLPKRIWKDKLHFYAAPENKSGEPVWYEFELKPLPEPELIRIEVKDHKSPDGKHTHEKNRVKRVEYTPTFFDEYSQQPTDARWQYDWERKRVYRGRYYCHKRRQLSSKEITKLGLRHKPESQKPNLWRKRTNRKKRG